MTQAEWKEHRRLLRNGNPEAIAFQARSDAARFAAWLRETESP